MATPFKQYVHSSGSLDYLSERTDPRGVLVVPLFLTWRWGAHTRTTARRDLPPAGGFAPIKYKRNLPIKGPGGAVVFGAVALICGFGFWRVGLGNLEQRCVRTVLTAFLKPMWGLRRRLSWFEATGLDSSPRRE